MFDVVFFDLYETLVTAPWHRLAARWGRRLNVPVEDVGRGFDATRSRRGRGEYPTTQAETAAVVDEIGVSIDPVLVEDLMEIQRHFLDSQAIAFTDALPTLEAVSTMGVATGIISNCSRPTRTVVDRLGLRDAVHQVVLSYEVGTAKPDPKIFRYAMSTVGADTGLFIDDQVPYLDGAEAVGLATLQIIHPEATNPHPPSDHHEVVTSLAEVGSRVGAGS